MLSLFTVFKLLGLVVVLGTVGLFCHHLLQSIKRPGEAPIRWSWLIFLGWALELGSRPIEFLQECQNLYGDIFGIVVGGNRMFIVTDVNSTNCILRPNKDLTSTEFHDSILMNFFGVSKETIDMRGIDESTMRKFYSQYLLSDKYLHTLTLSMQRLLYQNTNRVVEGPKKLFDFLSRFIFHASMASIFNKEAGDDMKLYEAFMAFDKDMPYCAGGISLDYFKSAIAGRTILIDAANKYTENLSELMEQRWKLFKQVASEGKMNFSDAAKEQVAILWASVGNTMPATFWIIYYIVSNEKALEQLRAEMNESLSDLTMTKDITQEELNKLVFADACITETLRLSSGSLIMRIARENTSLTLASGKTYKFRKGDRVGLCPPLFHYDEEIFPQAGEFNPWRWLQGETPEDRLAAANGKIPMSKGGVELQSSMTFLPFGAGLTLCPGRRFARNEIKILLVFLLNKFDFEIVDKKVKPVIDGGRAGIGIFPPRNDIMANIRKR